MKRLTLSFFFSLLTASLFAQSLPLLWESRFAGAGDNSDKFNKIIAVPGGDYVAVGFTTRNGKYKDFLTVKISGADLDTVWVRTKGVGDGDDEAITCAADAAGNIYVTGFRDGGKTDDDIYTVKYDPAGTTLWDTAYNTLDSALLDERPVDCGVDADGNFIIAGWTERGTWTVNQDDYLVLKYAPNGVLLWATRYDRSGFKDDATAMAIDAARNIFVTGRSSNGTDDDWATLKLDGTTGGMLWIPPRIFSGGCGDDRATAIALDNLGNPVVTGRARNCNGNDDYRTLKYSSAGVLQWTQAFAGAAGGHDRPTAIAVNQSTNDVYVTGQSDQSFSAQTDYDIVTRKYNASGITQWTKTWSGAALNDDIPSAIAVDPFGNIVLCGKTDADPAPNHSDFDWVTLKYDASGILQFAKTKNGTRADDDEAASLVVDAVGNAIVAGYINNTTTQKDAARIQYDAIGNQAFMEQYNGEGDFNESAHAMVQDAAGNTYIAGYSYTETDNRNIFAAKIDASGNMVDTFLMNGSNDDDDELVSIANDGLGNIYACGTIRTNGEKSNFMVLRFNFQPYPLADTVWSRQYNYISQSDKAISIAADPTGVYVTGESDANPSDTIDNDDIVTIKYNPAGTVLWSKRYDDALGWRDQPVKLILGMNNRVYVAGRNSNIHDDDIILLAYDRTTGDSVPGFPQIWNSNFQDDDRPTDIIEDANGTIYIAGYSQSGSFVEDYTVLQCDSTGSLQWYLGYDGIASNEDRAKALALDASGNIVVTGKTDVDNSISTNYNYGTFIYDPSGNYVCSASLPFMYNGAGDGDDDPVAVHVNGDEILVTGQSAEGTINARNKNIMVRIYSEGACNELQDYIEYDGPAGGGDAPNAVLLAAPAIFITGSSDGADMQKDIITLKYDVSTALKAYDKPLAYSMVYPNPLTGESTILLSDELNGKDLTIRMYNVLGEEVMEMTTSRTLVPIDAGGYRTGVYSYQVMDEGRPVAGGRFIVQ